MQCALKEILELANAAPADQAFLSVLFGQSFGTDRRPPAVVLYSAGGLGIELARTMQNHDIPVKCIFDNGSSKAGTHVLGIPVLSGKTFSEHWQGEPILISSRRHADEIYGQLIARNVPGNAILCSPQNPETAFLYSYAMIGSQTLITGFARQYRPLTIQDILTRDEEKIQAAYDLLADEKSRNLFSTKLALLASGGNIALLKSFITRFSEPYRQFGMFGREGTTESLYYFDNDVMRLQDDEVYVDVGAFDGDTILTFIDACKKQGVNHDSIIAFEPDPPYFAKLIETCEGIRNVECLPLGLGDKDGSVRFMTSDQEARYHVGIEHAAGEHEVRIVTLDNFLDGKPVTLIKMDPGANIIPKLLTGTRNTIARYRPKLALGVYHSLQAIYEIPLQVHAYSPDYNFYLRHGTYHLSDTDLFAIPVP